MKKPPILLPALVVVLVVVATAAALLLQGNAPPVPFITPRGEHAMLEASGLYRDLPASVAREGIVWDVVNLFVAVPAFILGLVFARRGSLRGRLVVAGLSFYFAYTYLTYATLIFNSFFLVYVAAFALSLVSLFRYLAWIEPAEVKSHVTARFPRRTFAGFAFASALLIGLLWIVRVVDIMRSGFPPELAGLTSLETQALDLGVVIPLSIASGVLLLKRHPWGYVLTALQLTFGFIMFLTIPAWIAVPLIQDGTIRVIEAVPFLVLCAIGVVLVALFLRNVRDESRLAPA